MKRLEGKVAVVAGGAGGIGTATSVRLASEGACVVVGDVDGDAASAIAQDIKLAGGQAIGMRLDLGDAASIAALFARADASFGGVDLLHCNGAAINMLSQDLDALTLDLGVWHQTLNINLTGYLLCTRQATPRMLAKGGGAIVYTSSGAAFLGEESRLAYAVSKTGMLAIVRHVAKRWGKEGIRANAIAPGLVATPALEALPQEFRDDILAQTPSTRLGKPGDIAAMVAMLMSDDGEWINGQTLGVDGGILMR